VAAEQPPPLAWAPAEVTAALATLAIGGAERIVLDWAARTAARHRVRLVVLRDAREEWPVPPAVELIRLGGEDLPARLQALGERLAGGDNPVVLCHLLTVSERDALARGGACPIPVVHNARPGWLEPASALAGAAHAVAVSEATAAEVRAGGGPAACTVIRHLPETPGAQPEARRLWRARWAIAPDAFVVGMIGAVKPQKAYPRALRVLAALLERRSAYLVILGGPVGRDGALAWQAVLAQATRLGVAAFVRLPGFVPAAARCLPAFDVLLNTSHYEGLSVATLEALAAGVPVVASEVGGQGEVGAPGLVLHSAEAPDAEWAASLDAAGSRRPARPGWAGLPSHRLWTLSHLAAPVTPGPRVLFVTANLNAGGAQRSLANLAVALAGSTSLEVAVTGPSSADAFTRTLRQAGLRVYRTGDSRDCFDHAEALVRRIVAASVGLVCLWNVDPKVKLLLVKALGWTRVRFVDVSPGAFSFDEMAATADFQRWIAFSEADYHARLDRLVLKYHAPAPAGLDGRTVTIPNGVAAPRRTKARFGAGRPRLVVSGRIAPSKSLLEIVAAWRLVRRSVPDVELHVLGTAEPRHREYAARVLTALGDELDRAAFVHGAAFDAPERLSDHDVAVVLGEHQGCPNAVLEALAAGLAVVANDSGGTRELVIDEQTGLLVREREPAALAAAITRLLRHPELARRLAEAGRGHVARHFSLTAMAAAYEALFAEVAATC
jgi:glycosyltransferase involved in cell wall biosynthesis